MSKPIVIALAGDMFHGKTTVAKDLEKTHGARRHRFAGPIKALVVELLVQAGEQRDHALFIVDDPKLKDVPIRELYGRTPRQFMRAIGDFGRAIDPQFWANIIMTRILAEHRDDPRRVFVIDDWRYPEGEGGRMLQGDLNVTFARVNRPGYPRAERDHDSEGGLDDWDYDFVITNHEGGLRNLSAQADRLLDQATGMGVD